MKSCVLLLAVASCRFHFDDVARDSSSGDGAAAACVTGVVAKLRSACALRADNTVWCFGANNQGQLGDGVDSPGSAVPVRAGALADVEQIVNAAMTVFARTSDGRVMAWGDNRRNQLAVSTAVMMQRRSPDVVANLPGVVEIAAGESHACALTANGDAYCWGWNAAGQVGNGTTTNQATPVNVFDNLKSIAAGGRNTCGIRVDDVLVCWGNNAFGQIGLGNQNDPQAVPVVTGVMAKEVVIGGRTICVRGLDDRVSCSGKNQHGQLGDGTQTDRTTFLPVNGLPPVAALYAGTGGRRMCARTLTGENWCWGETMYGTLGLNPPLGIQPAARVPMFDGSTLLVTASGFSCMRDASGALQCGGLNDLGQLGDGTMTSRVSLAPTMLACP